jgi:hypothetical protein
VLPVLKKLNTLSLQVVVVVVQCAVVAAVLVD